MRFTKMQGVGNDYVFVDGFRDALPAELPELARRISARHHGVGGDGLIALEPAEQADFGMRIFNADGSEAEMCGNGLRCAFKYLRDRGVLTGERALAHTGAGLLEVRLVARGPDADIVGVHLGRPRLEAEPARRAGADPRRVPLEAEGRRFEAACVSVGNPHAVIFLEEPLATFDVARYGPRIERHAFFPERTNVEFARCQGRHEVTQRTWERGSGETAACGTGACAVVVAGCLTGRLESPVTVHLRGGDLRIEWPGENEAVYLEGPAVEVFEGEWRL
ncbi:MAG: diaminopimelate epimerase [Planctomycetes bacterium]|nr:diaminopimelate epimerase [Planctomycetota bacterium]